MASKWKGEAAGFRKKPSHSGAQDDSSDSDAETEPAKDFHRRISTNKEIKTSAIRLTPARKFPRFTLDQAVYFNLVSTKDGYLMKHTSSFQSNIFDEIELTDLSVAECSTKNINHSFQVITPFRNLVLCADSRREMEEWITALKTAGKKEYYEPNTQHREMMSGQHNWYACSHARPTYCNVCKEALSGVTSHGLSCEVCKFKAHKKCAVRATANCKWTSLASIGIDIIEDEEGVHMPHQWLEGNLPVSAKCTVCDKTCGSVLRLQDWRCIWCRAMVHTSCQDVMPPKCPLGQCRVSILPPTAINSMDSDGYWEASRPPGTSPLLVCVNSKSGDNQGVKFLRRFKQLLNPAQVFDLMNGGPHPGLRLFQKFDQFRILVCGGDGSVGWVLTEIDKLDIHRQVGVLPFGTGNDLARVLGWGAAFDDDTQLHAILEKLEHSQIKMLDRWSILTYEGTMPAPRKLSQQFDPISMYEDNVATHLSKILHSSDHSVVISSAKVLCETVKDFVAKVGEAHETDGEKGDGSISSKCVVLNEKLESLLKTLNEEAQVSAQVSAQEEIVEEPIVGSPERDTVPGEITGPMRTKSVMFKPRDALMSRANSLKKAIRQIIEHTERAVDEQNAQTEQQHRELERLMQSAAEHPDPPVICEEPGESSFIADLNILTDNRGSHSAPSFAVYTAEAEPELKLPSLGTQKIDGSRSPRGPTTRRISSMSMFNKSSSVGSNLSGKVRDKSPIKDIPIPSVGLSVCPMLPGISSSIAGRLAGGSFISKVLLANADALCAAASPLIEEEIPLEEYTEKCVMNNYFGIGLDAKITLDFHLKREEHPEKCRSRTKNFMWYGVLGGKEILQRTFKNLDQRVQLECDGQRIPLPSLQGIVILNIPSYMGGANFWGGTKEDDNFTAPSFDDKILEVVAVFGSMQMAVSRVIDLHHHRIAQCRTVKVTIMGDEGMPVQVDGEAWIQPPGYIRIVHKNRAQMLTRDRNYSRHRGQTFENILKSWSVKQKVERPVSPQPQALTDDEALVLHRFVDASAALIRCVKVAAISHSSIEQELFPLATDASDRLDNLYPSGKLSEVRRQPYYAGTSELEPGATLESQQPTLRSQVSDFVSSIRSLYNETNIFLCEKAPSTRFCGDLEARLSSALSQLEVELRKVVEIGGIIQFQTSQEEVSMGEHKRSKGGKLKQVYCKLKGKGKEKEREKDYRGVLSDLNVNNWSPIQVGQWLDTLSLGEYKENFIQNEIRGSELLSLERRDLKELGVTKVGHLKRVQQGIKELTNRMAAFEKFRLPYHEHP